jgi:phage baseplate assembly protein W
MAIILGSKVVKDLPENEHVAIGITLPFRRGNNGFFAQSYQTIDQVKSNIKNLLLTARGERLMHPNFGTGLQELLFSPNTTDLENKIQNTIESAVSYWIPYVTIQDILVEQSTTNKDLYMFTVSITFTIGDQQNLETVTFNILG